MQFSMNMSRGNAEPMLRAKKQEHTSPSVGSSPNPFVSTGCFQVLIIDYTLQNDRDAETEITPHGQQQTRIGAERAATGDEQTSNSIANSPLGWGP